MSKCVPFKVENGPVVVLVRPQMAENMGMVARAMMNCSLSELRLICPREKHLSAKAVAASSGAQEILEHAHVYDTLTEALADVQFVLATTARPRDMTKPVYHPDEAIKLVQNKVRKGLKTAILFGAERTGLENEEIVPADGIVEIPLNPKHCSLNLSQAVLLIGYTWFHHSKDYDNTHFETGRSKIATKKELDAFLTYLEEILSEKGYFRWVEKKTRMSRNLRNIFTRNNLTSAEIQTLYGMIGSLTKESTPAKTA